MPDRGPLDQVPAIHYLLIIICMQCLPQPAASHAVQCHVLYTGGVPRNADMEEEPGCHAKGAWRSKHSLCAC